MKIKNVKIYGLEESMIRSGYPMQTGEPDFHHGSAYEDELDSGISEKRANKLAKVPSGTGHDNFMKGIIVQFDLQYPEYFSPQLQRYSWIDIISSQSKMHKITSRKLEYTDFADGIDTHIVDHINYRISKYNSIDVNSPGGDLIKKHFFQKIMANLPSGYLKWMGISTNYLQLKTIYNQRRNHKLKEWQYFCDWIETLPMNELITGKNG